MDLPTDIVRLVLSQSGDVLRADPAAVRAELIEVGVPSGSQLGAFFLAYQVSPMHSRHSAEELMDIVSPSRQLAGVSAFVRETYQVPAGFLCLTSAEAEGFYLYERGSEAVFDLSVRDLPALEAGSASPRWPDFFTFIRWYLS